MTSRSWIRNLFALTPRTVRKEPARFRPRLEPLEDRLAPATFTVRNTNDSGADSLRQAIIDANAASGADTIAFDGTVFNTPQTITLTSGELDISDDVTMR